MQPVPTLPVVPFVPVFVTGLAAILASFVLDLLWVRVLPFRTLYLAVRAPGIVLHECSHILACLITGAKVQKVVLFSGEGGSVKYSRPALPVLGDVLISSAPLFCIPLVLYGLTAVFADFLACTFPAFAGLPAAVGSPAGFSGLAIAMADLFWQNLGAAFHPWFLLYLYLALSLVLSMAPSGQDARNAAVGIALLAVAVLLVMTTGFPPAIAFLAQFFSIIGTCFTLALSFALLACILSLPPALWYIARRRAGSI